MMNVQNLTHIDHSQMALPLVLHIQDPAFTSTYINYQVPNLSLHPKGAKLHHSYLPMNSFNFRYGGAKLHNWTKQTLCENDS